MEARRELGGAQKINVIIHIVEKSHFAIPKVARQHFVGEVG